MRTNLSIAVALACAAVAIPVAAVEHCGAMTDEQKALVTNDYGNSELSKATREISRLDIWVGSDRYYSRVMNAKQDVEIGELIFHRQGEIPEGYEKAGRGQTGYLKTFDNRQTSIRSVYLEEGESLSSSNKATIGTFEFCRGTEGESQSFTVGRIEQAENSVFRIQQYSDDDFLSKAETKFHAGELIMEANTGFSLGKRGKLSAKDIRVDEIWAGYAVDDDGKPQMSDVEDGTIGIGTSAKAVNVPLQVGTINVGNSCLLSDSTVKDIGLALTGLNATTFTSLPDTDTITVNLNHANSAIRLGAIGSTADDAPVSLDIHVGVEGYGNEMTVASMQDGAAVDLSVPGEVGKSAFEVAKGVGGLLQIAKIEGEGGRVSSTIEVGHAGLNDGTVITVEYATDDEGNVTPPDWSAVEDPNAPEVVVNTVPATLSEIAALGFMQFRETMNDLQYRLGELRDHAGYKNGVWARLYQGKDEYGSQNIENEYFGFQAGYDHRIEGTDVILGGAVKYVSGESTFDTGDGENGSFDFTAYGTWLGENGMFLDGTLRYAALKNEADMRAVDGERLIRDGISYDTNALSVSLEAGWRLPVSASAYVEPQAEVMYGHVWKADYDYDRYRVDVAAADALVGRLGLQAGLKCPNEKGGVYARASVLHDFKGETETSFRYADLEGKRTMRDDLGGTWYELGIGGNWNVTDATYVYADFRYADGGEIDTPWRWSLGVRHAF